MNTSNGWEKLDCGYFTKTCRDSFSALLETHGFIETGLTPGGGVIFSCEDVFLKLNYDTNLYPHYGFTAAFGFGKRAHNNHGEFSRVPLWYVVPKEHPYHSFVHWTFNSEGELRRVLSEVKDELFVSTFLPLLLNRDGLERLVREFESGRK